MPKVYELTGATTYATLQKTYTAGVQYPETDVKGLLTANNAEGKPYFTPVGELDDLKLVGLTDGEDELQLTAPSEPQDSEPQPEPEPEPEPQAEPEQGVEPEVQEEPQPEVQSEPEPQEEGRAESKRGVVINKRSGTARNKNNAVTI